MTEHYTKRTEEVTAWCKSCNRVTPHRVSAGRQAECLELDHKPTPARYYCDVCKEGTPHQLIEGKPTCLRCKDKKAKQQELPQDDTLKRHLAALDGSGNRGESSKQ